MKELMYEWKLFAFVSVLFVVCFCCPYDTMCQSTALIKNMPAQDSKVREMVDGFSQLLFAEMKPRQAFARYLYVGSLTSEETSYFERKFLHLNKRVPNSLRLKYYSLVAAKQFPELYLIFGNSDMSPDFAKRLHIELDKGDGKLFHSLLTNALKKHGVTQKEFDNFFTEDGRPVTSHQIMLMKQVIDSLIIFVKGHIDSSLYSRNLNLLNEQWKIQPQKLEKHFAYLVISKPLLSFIVAIKAKQAKIIEFPEYVD